MVCSSLTFADQICQGVLEDITVKSNVKVSTDCKLVKVKVDGNIILLQNAALKILNSDVQGNIESSGNFKSVQATNNNVLGNISLKQGQNIHLLGNKVNGNIVIEKNQGDIFIQNNRVNGNLKCQENLNSPKGGQNYVKSDKEQQCRAL